MDVVERVRNLVLPILERHETELYDVEHASGVLRIMVDRPGGIDVDTIGDLATEISSALDSNDPLPDSRYLLEVTSPGIERRLRTPSHFLSQLGAEVNLKVKTELAGSRRREVRLEGADETGIEVSFDGAEGPERHRVPYEDIESARTIFHWGQGSSPNDSESSGKRPSAKIANPKTTKKKAAAR